MKSFRQLKTSSKQLAGRVRSKLNERRGAMLLLMSAMMFVFIAMSAFTVDVAWMQLIRTEMRASTDAAAKAAVEALARQQSPRAAKNATRRFARFNKVAGKPLILTNRDIVLGRTISRRDGSHQFVPNRTPFTSAQVSVQFGRRARNKPVNLFFSHMLGIRRLLPAKQQRPRIWKTKSCSPSTDRTPCALTGRGAAGDTLRTIRSRIAGFGRLRCGTTWLRRIRPAAGGRRSTGL